MPAIVTLLLAILSPAWLFQPPLLQVTAPPHGMPRAQELGDQGQAPPPAQVPARDARTPVATGTGVIRGRVVDADTGEPLRRARVSLTCPETRLSRAVPSDIEGRYEFRELPACRYHLSFSKNFYVMLGFGQRRPFQAGKPIELGDGQVLDKLDMALPRGGVITGRVTDDLGEPAAGMMVTVMRRTVSDGRRQLTPFGMSSETDDLGRFRIAGLPTGTYYVGTRAFFGFGAAAEEGFTFAQTYFPGTADTAEAQPVSVRAGQERAGVNIALAASRAVSLSGTAVDSSGNPLAMATITLHQSAAGMTTRRSESAQPDGRFTVTNVAPGEYTLSASARSQNTGDVESAYTQITAAGVDLDGIVLAVGPGSSVVGRVEFEEGVAPAFSPTSLSVQLSGPGTIASAVVRSDWTFELKNVWPGRNAISVSQLPTGWAVRAVSIGGRETPDGRIEVNPNETLSGVLIVLSNRTSVLSGTVIDEKGAKASDYTVVVFSEDSARWTRAARSIATASPDQRGEYKVAGLRPGRYFAIALEYVDQGDEYDPEFLQRWRGRATRVELADGEPVTLDLKLVRIEG